MDERAGQERALVIDGHNDTLVAHIRRGNWSLVSGAQGNADRHAGVIAFMRGQGEPWPDAAAVQINLPLMRRAGITAGLFAIDVTPAWNTHLAYALDGLGYLLNDLDAHRDEAIIVRRAEDIPAAQAAGKLALILAIEHADVTERSLNVLRALYEVGVRSIGLPHNVSSWEADGNAEARDGTGLTHYGRQLVLEMNRLGMLVDLAHVSPGAFYDALGVSTKPVVFSHGNARALCDHPRNLTDDQLRALAQNGGVIGMSYVPFFIAAANPTLERLIDHIDHVVQVAGIGTVGLGSDFDGGGTLLADASETPHLIEGLFRRGYSESDVRLILGGNFWRVLQATLG